MNASEIIDRIETSSDYQAREWSKGNHTRVYVSRTLSRGRRQDMGYIEVSEDGDLGFGGLDRNRAGIRDMVQG